MNHFIKYSNCNKDFPVRLILDNRDNHTTSTSLQIRKVNGIILLTQHSHISQHLQLLDRVIFRPFKTYYKENADDYGKQFW